MNTKIMLLAGVLFAASSTAYAQINQSDLTVTNQTVTSVESTATGEATTTSKKIQIQNQIKERQSAKIEEKAQAREEKCKNIETKIDTKVKRYENNRQMFTNVYTNMSNRMDRLVSRLDTAGADTSKLKADITILKEKINKLYADYDILIAGLKDSQNSACGQSQGEFAGKVNQSRKVFATIIADRQDIKNFFQATIKTDLQAIRKELETQTQATAEEEKKPTAENKTNKKSNLQ